jgi:Glycosyltransferase family 87
VVLSGTALAAGREPTGGALAGILLYKPQLGIPIVGTLLLRGRWAGVVAVVGMVALHWALGAVATGGRLDWPIGWLETVRDYQEADLVANGWQAISLPGLAGRAALALDLPWLVIVGYAAAAVVIGWCLPALRRLPWPDAIALAAALGLLVSPHAWVYDATLLLPALGVMAVRSGRRGWPWRDRWWLAAAFGIALLWPLGGVVGGTLMPLVVLAVPFALLERGPWRDPELAPS